MKNLKQLSQNSLFDINPTSYESWQGRVADQTKPLTLQDLYIGMYMGLHNISYEEATEHFNRYNHEKSFKEKFKKEIE